MQPTEAAVPPPEEAKPVVANDSEDNSTTAEAAVPAASAALAGEPNTVPPVVEDEKRDFGAQEEESSEKEEESKQDDEEYRAVLESFTASVSLASRRILRKPGLAGIAEYIASGQCRRIICMCGAGISVSAGIPDFRTPGTGLYSRLQEYGLPHPTAVFELGFFKSNPKPFFTLAKELFPGNYPPTPTHHFLKLLHDKGLLLRCFTQNIDSLEAAAKLPPAAIIAAHGNFDSAHCVECNVRHEVQHVRKAVFASEICRCVKTEGCNGLVKPSIVFFGEGLPAEFFHRRAEDFPNADLLIVMGTSLVVNPFASLINVVGPEVPRLLINREAAGTGPEWRAMGRGFDFSSGSRDVHFEGDCDDGVRELCRLLGWDGDLQALVEEAAAGTTAAGVAAEVIEEAVLSAVA